MNPTVLAVVFLAAIQVLSCSEPVVIQEVRGSDVLSQIGTADASSFNRANALRIAEQFQRANAGRYKLARLVLFSSTGEATRFGIGKGNFHPRLEEWRTAQQQPKPCPALEVLSIGNSLSVRLCESDGYVQNMTVAGADLANWRNNNGQPSLAYISIQPGMYLRAEGPVTDKVRVRLFFVSADLPKLEKGRQIIQKWSQVLERPLQVFIQVSGRFPFDVFYPYLNPFLPTHEVSLHQLAQESVLSCYLRPEPFCRLASGM